MDDTRILDTEVKPEALASRSPRFARRLHLPAWARPSRDNLSTALIALALAVAIWLAAAIEQNPSRDDFFPGDIPVELINKPASLVLFQPFERSVRVRVRAPQATWDRMQSGADRQQAARAVIDLSGATAGLHVFDVQVKFADPDVSILSVDPASVSLRLEEYREKPLPVQVSVGDSPPVGFLVGTPESNPVYVQVSGPQSLVDQVVEVIAAVQLRGAKTSIERESALVARDAQGNTVSGVRVAPDTVTVRVPVEQRLGFKDVSVKAVTRGSVASGYWLSNITVNPNTLTVVGSPARLDEIGGFVSTDPIDVKDARNGFVSRVNLVLPDGVTPVDAQSVVVTIDVQPIIGGQTVQRQIIVRGLDPALTATVSPESVDVILGGPLPILQSLRPDDVQVIIDLTNKAPGKYKVSPTVAKPDALRVESIVPDTIEVTISR